MRTIIKMSWALLAWLLIVVPVAAELATAPDIEQGRLWRITKGEQASYLMGTMHSEHADVVTLPLIMRTHFDSAQTLVLEMVMDRQTITQVAEAQIITRGPLLPELLGKSLYTRTVEAMSGYGLPEHALRNMKPWFVMSVLMMPKSKTGLFLDLQLYYEALAQGKQLVGLETAQEQIAVFDTIPLADQVAMLEDTLDNLGEMENYFATMREIYLSGDLDKLEQYSNDMMASDDPELVQRFNQRFIVDRNVKMVERMMPQLDEGGAFIAVGALHLPGDSGILRLLQEKGYQVSVEY